MPTAYQRKTLAVLLSLAAVSATGQTIQTKNGKILPSSGGIGTKVTIDDITGNIQTPGAISGSRVNRRQTVYPDSEGFLIPTNAALAMCSNNPTNTPCNIELETANNSVTGTNTLASYLLIKQIPNVHIHCATKDPIVISYNYLTLNSNTVSGVPRYMSVINNDASDNFELDGCVFNISNFDTNTVATAPAVEIWGANGAKVHDVSVIGTFASPFFGGMLCIRVQGNAQYPAKNVELWSNYMRVPFIAYSTGNYSFDVNIHDNTSQDSLEGGDLNGSLSQFTPPSSSGIKWSRNTINNAPWGNYVEGAIDVFGENNTYRMNGSASLAFPAFRIHSISPWNFLNVHFSHDHFIGNPSTQEGIAIFNGAGTVALEDETFEGMGSSDIDIDSTEGGTSDIRINGVKSILGGSMNSKGLISAVPTPTSRGTSYLPGTELSVHDATGSNALIRVNSVDTNGAVQTISIPDLTFGSGYTGGTGATTQIVASYTHAGTYTSGVTAHGAAGSTCMLYMQPGFASATVTLSATDTLSPNTPLVFSSDPNTFGNLIPSPPTNASVGNGTATCTGNATVAGAFTGSGLTVDTDIYEEPNPVTQIALVETNRGNNYKVGDSFSIPCGATGSVTAVDGSGAVIGITLDNSGFNCTASSAVDVTGGSGTGLRVASFTNMAGVRLAQGNGFIISGGTEISGVDIGANNPFLTDTVFEAGDPLSPLRSVSIHDNIGIYPITLLDPCIDSGCTVQNNIVPAGPQRGGQAGDFRTLVLGPARNPLTGVLGTNEIFHGYSDTDNGAFTLEGGSSVSQGAVAITLGVSNAVYGVSNFAFIKTSQYGAGDPPLRLGQTFPVDLGITPTAHSGVGICLQDGSNCPSGLTTAITITTNTGSSVLHFTNGLLTSTSASARRTAKVSVPSAIKHK